MEEQLKQILEKLGTTTFGVIGGGFNNYVGPGTNHSAVFGGHGNRVAGNCSAILGGNGNVLSGNYSAILGGNLNNDNGFSNTGIFGNGLVATVGTGATGAPSNFWVDELIIANIPVDTTGLGVYTTLPLGALYTTVASPSPWGTRPIFVK